MFWEQQKKKKNYSWLWIVAAAAVVLAVVITLICMRPPREEDEDYFVTEHYYVDSTVADTDERLSQSYVNNSANLFFVKGDPLKSAIYFESQTAHPVKKSFYEQYRKKSGTLPSPKNLVGGSLRVLEDTPIFDGKRQTETLAEADSRLPFITLEQIGKKYYYKLGENRFIPAEKASPICRRTAFVGTLSHPYTVDINAPQLLSFDAAGDYIYMYFTSDNEFISFFLEGLPEGSSWELFNRNYRLLASGSSAEVAYRAPEASLFLLRVTAAQKAEVSLSFHRDQNEWQKNMTAVTTNKKYSGVFDYYGDEDFFVLEPALAVDIGQLVLEIKGADADLQVCAYNSAKQLVGRYTRKEGAEDKIALYGLSDVYALSLRTASGKLTNVKYTLRFYYQNVDLLGLETYGFKLSKPLELGDKGENYYTAVCRGLSGKRVTDVQTVGDARVTMTLTTASGLTFTVREGEDLPLRVGKNTLKIKIEHPTKTRELTISITDVNTYGVGYVFVTGGGTAVYNRPDETAGRKRSLSSGEKLRSMGVEQNGYLQIELSGGETGWVDKASLFVDYTRTTMPDSYKTAIEKLQRKHPNWRFTFVKAGITLEAAVSREAGNAPIIWRSGGWRTPSKSEIEYYMNPLNFLDEQNIFMFERQIYNEGSYSKKGIASIWREREGALQSGSYYADCFLEAGRSAGLSPYFIAARAAIESGYGTSVLSKGTSSGYEGYYNFYGINAVDANPKKGAVWAKDHNWHTQRIAIVEGAEWIKQQYIAAGQYTPYFIKYCFIPGRNWHQYMTDIGAPKEDAARCYEAHRAGGTLDTSIEFVIPVFY